MKKILFTLCCGMLTMIISICSGVNFVQADNLFNLTAKAVLLVDYNSGSVIYEKDKTKKLPIASMVKMMTIYLTLKNIAEGNLSLTDNVTTSEKASGMGGSQVFIDPYVNYSVEDLLKSVIISSANDASVALAEKISGSEQAFVDLMNTTAKSLGMNNTLYANSTGLPSPEQYSSAEDCVIIIKNVLAYDLYHSYSTIWMQDLVHPSGRKTELVNTNKLIRYYDGCDSGKTGSTSEAGYCLTASASKNNMRLICVVIGAKTGNDRFKETTTLFNYGFANYQNKQLLNKEIAVCNIKTNKCKQDNVDIIPLEDFYAFDKKGTKSNYDISYELPERIGATKRGEVVGSAIISKAGNVIATVNLTVKNDLTTVTYFDNFKTIINNWY